VSTKGIGRVPLSLKKRLAEFDQSRWERTCRDMQVRMLAGQPDAAVRILKEFCGNTTLNYATLDSHVGDVFNAEIASKLDRAGCITVRAADGMSDHDMLSLYQMGAVNVGKIRSKIRAILAGERFPIEQDDYA